MSCNVVIDSRGAQATIIVQQYTAIGRVLTITDANDSPVDLSTYSDIKFVIETDPVTEYKVTEGDMSITDTNKLTLYFPISIDPGQYEYRLLMETPDSLFQFMYGLITIEE